MELNDYLEQDIIKFLEEKANQQKKQLNQIREEEITLFSIDRDYAEETEQALQEENLMKAKKIFEELRNHYNELPKNSPEKEKVFAVLEEVYGKIKEYLVKRLSEKSLEDELKEMEEKKLNGEEETTIKEAFEKRALEDYKKIKETEQKMNQKITLIEESLKKQELEEAKQQYNELTSLYEEYPADEIRRKEWHQKIIEEYKKIKLLEEKHEKEQEQKQAEEYAKLKEQRLINHTKEQLKKIIEAIDKNEKEKAESLLIDVRHSLTNINDEEKKKILEKIYYQLLHKTQFLKEQKKQEQTTEEEKNNEESYKELKKELTEEPTKKLQGEKEIKETKEPKEAQEVKEAKEVKEEAKEEEKTIIKPEQIEEKYFEALNYQRNNEKEKAKKIYEAILRSKPSFLPAKIRLEQITAGDVNG